MTEKQVKIILKKVIVHCHRCGAYAICGESYQCDFLEKMIVKLTMAKGDEDAVPPLSSNNVAPLHTQRHKALEVSPLQSLGGRDS